MSNALLKLIKFGIGFILFIPLYIGGSFYFPFIFPKIWLFQLVTEIIFFFYVVVAISDNRFRPKFNLVLGALLLLTLILIITSFTGIDAFRSFWGNTERMSGVITWFHFVAFAIILSGVLKTEKEWQKFFGMAVIVSILEFFYALAQYFNVFWAWLPSSQSGTIGNADLLGSYAIFGAFFAFYLWQNAKSDFKNSPKSNFRYFWATAFFLNIGTLYVASSRGAIIGFISGVAIYVLFDIWQRKAVRKIWAITVISLLLIYGAFWSMRQTDFVKNNVQLTRLTNISLESDTVRQRFTEWGIAWEAFKARPIFGWGPNNYLYLHNVFLNPKVYELRETNFDRAHNAYLDYASMSGILGLFGYLFLIAVLFWVFFPPKTDPSWAEKNKYSVFASLIIAYAVQSFFVFDSPASYIALFLTIGFAVHTCNTQHATHNIAELRLKNFSPQVAAVFYVVCFMFTLYLIWQVNVKPTSANLAFTRAFTGLNNGAITPEKAFQDYRESLKYETLGTTEFRNQYTQWLQGALNKFPPETKLSVVDFGVNELEKEVKDHPLVFSYLNLGQLYYFKANGISNADLKPPLYQKAMQAYEKAIELSPKRLEVYYSYLQLAITIKDYSRGIEIIKKTTEIAPNYPKNWWYLGIANIVAGQNEDGIRYVNKALTMYYAPNVTAKNNGLDLEYYVDKILKGGSSAMPSKQEILGVVNPYIKEGRYKELLLLYLGAKMEDPNDIGIHQSLALVYQNLGFVEKMNDELKIIEGLQKK
ncbi:MAG: O-antigen ligase family protein [Candidatus Azambacteria bacterium]|nr:O-antigen ligase family protein [Candidatus Azambacteria bacterium]